MRVKLQSSSQCKIPTLDNKPVVAIDDYFLLDLSGLTRAKIAVTPKPHTMSAASPAVSPTTMPGSAAAKRKASATPKATKSIRRSSRKARARAGGLPFD